MRAEKTKRAKAHVLSHMMGQMNFECKTQTPYVDPAPRFRRVDASPCCHVISSCAITTVTQFRVYRTTGRIPSCWCCWWEFGGWKRFAIETMQCAYNHAEWSATMVSTRPPRIESTLTLYMLSSRSMTQSNDSSSQDTPMHQQGPGLPPFMRASLLLGQGSHPLVIHSIGKRIKGSATFPRGGGEAARWRYVR